MAFRTYRASVFVPNMPRGSAAAVRCDLCRDADAVHGFKITDAGFGWEVVNCCAFCMDVQTKGMSKLVRDYPGLTVTLGAVA